MRYSAAFFEKIVIDMLGLSNSKSVENKRTIRSVFGISFQVMAELWRLLKPTKKIARGARPRHLLWAFIFLRVYGSEKQNCLLAKCKCRKTYRFWTWAFLEALANLDQKLIRFEKRFEGWDPTNAALITVDGTDCRIKEPSPFNPVWWSHKFNGPGVKYEIGICIATGDIVWVNGPFPAAFSDKQIFDSELSLRLFPGEMVEADGGYTGRPQIATPGMGKTSRSRKAKSQARGRHENVNGLAKAFNCLDTRWRHDLDKHGIAMRAILVTKQCCFNLGEKLYPVDFTRVNYD